MPCRIPVDLCNWCEKQEKEKVAYSFKGPLWTSDDRDFLCAHASEKTIEEWAAHFGRSEEAIRKQLYKRKLRPKPGPKTHWWTPADDTFIRENALTMPVKQIAQTLRRTQASVRDYAYKKRIPLIATKRPWSREELTILMSLSEKHTLREIVKKLGRSKASVRKIMETRGWKALSALKSPYQIMEETGYSRWQLNKAREVLGQKWRRVYRPSSRSKYNAGLTQAQEMEICLWLKNNGKKEDTPTQSSAS